MDQKVCNRDVQTRTPEDERFYRECAKVFMDATSSQKDGRGGGTPVDGAHAVSDVHRFETGAVQSTDADKYRLELITPIGLRYLAHAYGNATYEDDMEGVNFLDACLGYLFSALEGGEDCLRTVRHLGFSAMYLCEAIAEEAGENREAAYEQMVGGGRKDAAYSLIPWAAMEAVGRAYAVGAKKYSAFNWEKGMPADSILNHAIRHIYLDFAGDESEDQKGHALWRILAAIHSLILWPSLNRGSFRRPGCRPPEGILTDEQEEALYRE